MVGSGPISKGQTLRVTIYLLALTGHLFKIKRCSNLSVGNSYNKYKMFYVAAVNKREF